MELTSTKSDLLTLIQTTQPIAEKKTTMPILGNLLLVAEKGILRITGSDMEITATASCSADVSKTGRITIASRLLSDVIRELPDGGVTLKVSDGYRIEIRAGSSVFKMIGQGADEYPLPKSVTLGTKSKIPAKLLLEMIEKTAYATSQDETKYYLAGICLELKEKTLRMVSTDGHRLALVTRDVPKFSLTSLGKKSGTTRDHVIVPKKGLIEAKKVLDQNSEIEVGIDVNEGFLILEVGQAKYIIRLIDGEYPEYSQVIPSKSIHTVALPAGTGVQALRRVALMVSDKGKPVKLELEPGTIRISSSSPEIGEASEEMQVDSKGTPLIVGFNARYLLEAFSSFKGDETVLLELDGESGPALLKSEKDDSYLAVVMPLRVE